MGFLASEADHSIFYCDVRGERVYLLGSVDDLLLAVKSLDLVKQVKGKLQSKFNV